uniref:transmembrane protein 275 n=1 Tax=Myxine glutinosa TaxID=7769 RepID=UPI00358EECDA
MAAPETRGAVLAGPARRSKPRGMPSPALCCACGLCIMLAGINITLVGAFAFGSLAPGSNPPIIIGPSLLALACLFFAACCFCSRRPSSSSSGRSRKGLRWGTSPGVGGSSGSGRLGSTAFELDTSEHTAQDTTAIQLSPSGSLTGSRPPSPGPSPPDALPGPVGGICRVFTLPDDQSMRGPSWAEQGVRFAPNSEAVQLLPENRFDCEAPPDPVALNHQHNG